MGGTEEVLEEWPVWVYWGVRWGTQSGDYLLLDTIRYCNVLELL